MFAIIYSEATGRIRSIYKVDNQGQIDTYAKDIEDSGQALLSMDDKEYADLHTLQDKLNSITKLTPADDRYAIVCEKGKVVGAVIADPSCGDEVAGHELVKSADAVEGWTCDLATKELSPPADVDALDISAKPAVIK